MAETLLDNSAQTSPSIEGHTTSSDALTFRERFNRRLQRMGEGTMSFLNLSAGIILAQRDLQRMHDEMGSIDGVYDGLITRQTADDTISVALESDVLLDFRRDAQRAGFTDVDAIPQELRAEIAAGVAESYFDEFAAELSGHHPDLDLEELQAAARSRTDDVITLLSMNAEARDGYRDALFQYQELQGRLPDLEAELSGLRDERSDRLSRMGGVAVSGLVNLASRARNVPNAVSARVMIAGMNTADRVGSWYVNKTPEGQRSYRRTAAGIAIAGLAGYIAFRFGAGHVIDHGSTSIQLAGNSTPLVPGHIGGTVVPDHIGNVAQYTIPNTIGTPVVPDRIGGNAPVVPNYIGSTPSVPDKLGAPTVPPTIGGNAPIVPNQIGNPAPTVPNRIGNPNMGPQVPNFIGGGGDLSSAKTSSELFSGSGPVNEWPTSITVSHWNSHNLDGSLSGISQQILHRAGFKDPTDEQIYRLVDALRPQAQPNGYLLDGQKLDLRPATALLKQMSQ